MPEKSIGDILRIAKNNPERLTPSELKFLAKLKRKKKDGAVKDRGQAHREVMAARSRAASASVADIGEIPGIVNPHRREDCRYDLLQFLTTYFPNSTGLDPFSDDHKTVIARIQACALHGGRFVNAVYRSFAKTTIAENSSIWATFYGHRKFVPMFGAEAGSGEEMVSSLKLEMSENNDLYDDFPEVCFPIRALENKPQRCYSQTHHGKLTHIGWTADTIVLPMIEGSAAGGAVIRAKGFMAASRGMKFKRADGVQARPDFVIVDDPQTDESAQTEHQVNKRLKILKKSILKQTGHQKSLAIIINATVIEHDDMIDYLLGPKEPSWQGERIPMVRSWSGVHDELWLAEYARIRNTYDPDNVDSQTDAHRAATKFYADHRCEMDEGCKVSWDYCFDSTTELSAIQHAYNALIDDGEEVFASEYQQKPLVEDTGYEILTAAKVLQKWNGRKRGVVPSTCNTITAFIDVHDNLLYWTVVAWESDFTGYVIDYGTLPDQAQAYFSQSRIRNDLARMFAKMPVDEQIHNGLEHLMGELLTRMFPREDGSEVKINRLLVDRGHKPPVVEAVCRRINSDVVMPAIGRGITAAHKPFSEYSRAPGLQVGFYWIIPSVRKIKELRYVQNDVNYWKSFLSRRLLLGNGVRGTLSIYGDEKVNHRLFADHMVAEKFVRTFGRGRIVDQWICPAGRDNHWFDCLVGCCAAASQEGISIDGQQVGVRLKREKVFVKDRVRLNR